MSEAVRETRECQICAGVKKSVFACPYCAYESCLTCNERIILDSINPPACASCRREWSSDFFYSVFTRSFLSKRYKQHREQLLYEREKSLLPATQPQVARAKVKMEHERELAKCRRDLNEARAQVRLLHHRELVLKNRLWRIEQGDEKAGEKSEKKEDTYVGPCPVNDCRGFLNKGFQCGLCATNVCAECREIVNKGEESEESKNDHVCNPDTVATVKELAKTTKQCPNCHAPIFKIDGCDQMWCVKCNVAFSWQTGRVQNGAIHNPHYFEYLRSRGGQLPRNPNEVLCGGMPPAEFLIFIRGTFAKTGRTYSTYITDIYRLVNHVRHVLIRALPGPFDNVSNQDLRVEFLLSQITEDEFKVKLQRREKDRNKRLEQRSILETYCNVVQDLLTKLYQEGVQYMPYSAVNPTRFWTEESAETFIREETNVRKFTREAYHKMNVKYDSNITCPI